MRPDRYALFQIARGVAEKVVRKAIHRLRQLGSVDGVLDSDEAINFWDVVCIDKAYRETGLFEVYDLDVQQLLSDLIEDLDDHEQLALWLPTQDGFDWSYAEAEVHHIPALDLASVARYVADEFLYREAKINPSRRALKQYEWSG